MFTYDKGGGNSEEEAGAESQDPLISLYSTADRRSMFWYRRKTSEHCSPTLPENHENGISLNPAFALN